MTEGATQRASRLCGLLVLLFLGLGRTAVKGQTLAYVTHPSINTVSVVNIATNSVVDTIPISNPTQIAASPDAKRLYVSSSQTFAVIDLGTKSVVVNPRIGVDGIALTPDGGRAYATSFDQISVINTATNAVVQTISYRATLFQGRTIAITPDGRRAYVPTFDSYVMVLDTATNQVVSRIEIPGILTWVAIAPDGRRAYVEGPNGTVVIDIASNRIIATIPFGGPVAFSPDSSRAYFLASAFGISRVWVVATVTNALITTIPLPPEPAQARDIAITADGSRAYVVLSNPSSISVIDTSTNRVTASIPLDIVSGDSAIAMTPSPATTGRPVFTAAAVTNGASFASGLTPGSIVTVFGTRLSNVSGIVQASSLPLPTQIMGTSVTVNGVPAPLFAIANVSGSEQINLQVPYEVTGQSTATLIVNNNGLLSDSVEVSILPAQPGIFTLDGTAGAILHANGQIVSSTSPASRGEVVLVYATGLGPVSPAPRTGSAAPSSPLSVTTFTPVVSVGGIDAEVLFSGLAPGFVGLYQVNVRIPGNAPSGNLDIVIQSAGQASKPVKIAVQ